MSGECSIKNWGTCIWAVRHLHAKSSALLWAESEQVDFC